MGRKSKRKKQLAKPMNETKRRRLEHYVFNIMSRKDKGRAKGPVMTKNCGKVIKSRREYVR